MKVYAKQLIAFATVAAMVMPLAGCLDSNKQPILEAADAYAKAMTDGNLKSIRKHSLDIDDDFLDDLSEKLDVTGDDGDVLDAIAEKITYEVQEDTYELGKKKDEASVDVIFNIVDWESLQDDEDIYDDVNTYIEAIEDSEEFEEVTVTLEFELDDEDWLVANYEEACGDFFDAWTGAKAPVDYSNMVDHTTWYYYTSRDGDSIIYNNTDKIDMDISLADGFSGQPVYYEVSFNGSKVYTSETDSTSREGYYRSSYDGARVTTAGHLEPGEYTITFYAENGTMIASESCTVTEEATSSGGGSSEDTSSKAEIFDSRVQRIRWFYADDRSGGNIVYNSPSYIDLDLYFSGSNEEVYYEVEYNGTKVYTSETSTSSREGYFRTSYDGAVTDAAGNLAEGTYTITFYLADGTKLASDSCLVGSSGSAAPARDLTPNDVSSTYWWFADERDNGIVYHDCDRIDLDITLNPDVSGTPIYYEVQYNGTKVYTSETDSGSYAGYFRTSYDGAAVENGHLAAGTYTITFFSAAGTQLASDQCTVTNGAG